MTVTEDRTRREGQQDAMLGVPQWRARSLQLVNWGGFHGAHHIDLDPGATLVSGASGTGKSTLMDAYIALMMPFDVPFNGASNDATGGRARSAGQRNVPSYLRGKVDDQVDAGTDEMHARVLRGADTATWSAVSATFASAAGGILTALRTYYLPRGATHNTDVVMKMATIDGAINLADLAGVAASRFDKRELEKRFPVIRVVTSYAEFSTVLFTRLGIGAHGDGAKALRLLARIQAGHAVRTVDDLYKSMVLETPSTYEAADRAVEHFADLEAAYEAMQDEEAKLKELSGIVERHAEMQAAQAAVDLIDTFGIHRTGDTPFTVWSAGTEAALVAAADARNATDRARVKDDVAAAMREETDLAALIGQIEAEQEKAGGGVLRTLEADITRLEADQAAAAEARGVFTRATAALGVDVVDEAAFTDAQQQARTFLAGFEEQVQQAAADYAAAMGERWPISNEVAELRAERDSLTGRDGRVPRDLHEARVAIAHAAGRPVEEVPFVAELIDVQPGQEAWRTAIETLLFPLARVILVDERHLEHLSRAIDPIKLGVRVNFEGVPLAEHAPRSGAPGRVSGKLQYKESPFSAWVAARIASDRIDAVCVDTTDQLGGRERRVTRSGQMRHGTSGAHGTSRAPHIIGFTSAERIAEIDARLAALAAIDVQMAARVDDLTRIQRHLQDLRGAHQHILATAWRAIDVDGIAAQIADRTERRRQLLESSDRLGTLAAQHAQATAARDLALSRKYTAADRLRTLELEWADLVTRADELADELDRIERVQQVTVTEQQQAELDAQYTRHGNAGRLDLFSTDLQKVKERLAEQSRDLRDKARRAAEQLEATFTRFDARWYDPNRGTSVKEFEAYRDILDEIAVRGLAKRRQEWTRRVAEWSGQDLVPLNGAMVSAVEDIEERLHPVNDILAALPFGAAGHHLNIKLRRLHNDEVARFTRELRTLSSGSTEDLPDEQVLKRFTRLKAFIAQLRPPQAGDRSTSRRDVLLDVRKHVEITAVAVDDAGVPQATYASLGGKSGGEAQELIAFVVGAALRYQLGDEGNSRPTFAPVLLDEAFIKADSEFAGRAVTAWKGLGFQLVVGAPLDKVTGLEPHMDRILSVTKSARGFSHVTDITPVRDPAAGVDGGEDWAMGQAQA